MGRRRAIYRIPAEGTKPSIRFQLQESASFLCSSVLTTGFSQVMPRQLPSCWSDRYDQCVLVVWAEQGTPFQRILGVGNRNQGSCGGSRINSG